VPAFGGWEGGGGGGGGGAPPDYSLDFTKIRAARMQRRTKALSWSSFVRNAAAVEAAPGGGGEEERHHQQWSSAASEGDDDEDREHRRQHRHRRLRSDATDQSDDREPIRPGRAAPKVQQSSSVTRQLDTFFFFKKNGHVSSLLYHTKAPENVGALHLLHRSGLLMRDSEIDPMRDRNSQPAN